MNLQSIVSNLCAPARYATLENREYIVAPMVMLCEGVHAGSVGPLYYGPDEMGKNVPVWNHKPIVVYHPMMNGLAISACDPVVLENRKVGIILNTIFDADTNKLRAEAWIDIEKANKVDPRIVKSIEANEMMEVSTGLFTQNELTSGKWGKEEYVATAREFGPDHLALLPDKVGACSIADGAGLLQLNHALPRGTMQLINNTVAQLLANTRSHEDLRSTLNGLVRERYPSKDSWVVDVYDDKVVCEVAGELFEWSYEVTKTGTKLVGLPTEVNRVTSYVPVSNVERDNMKFDRKAFIASLIANEASPFAEEDRPVLEKMEDGVLEKFSKSFATEEDEEEEDLELNECGECDECDGTPKGKGKKKGYKKPALNESTEEPAKALTVEEYITNAPPEMQDTLREMQVTNANLRGQLIGVITANKESGFTTKELNAMPTDNLRKLAKLATPKSEEVVAVHNHGGSWFGAQGSAPVDNADLPTPLGLKSSFTPAK